MNYRNLPLALTLSVLILISSPRLSRAVGIDIGPIVAKLTEQLTEMTKQLKEFKKISTAAQDQINAVGKVGQISIPTLNSARLGAQIMQDAQCLAPDFSKLMPNVQFEDLNWNSVCQAIPAYKQALWLNPELLKTFKSPQERLQMNGEIKDRRERMLDDAVTKSLALAEVTRKDAKKENDVAKEIERNSEIAQTSREQFAVTAKSQAALLRSMTKNNQLLAQTLELQALMALHMGLPVESLLPPVPKEEGAQP